MLEEKKESWKGLVIFSKNALEFNMSLQKEISILSYIAKKIEAIFAELLIAARDV